MSYLKGSENMIHGEGSLYESRQALAFRDNYLTSLLLNNLTPYLNEVGRVTVTEFPSAYFYSEANDIPTFPANSRSASWDRFTIYPS